MGQVTFNVLSSFDIWRTLTLNIVNRKHLKVIYLDIIISTNTNLKRLVLVCMFEHCGYTDIVVFYLGFILCPKVCLFNSLLCKF